MQEYMAIEPINNGGIYSYRVLCCAIAADKLIATYLFQLMGLKGFELARTHSRIPQNEYNGYQKYMCN